MKVPFIDLEAQYNTIKDSLDKAIDRSLGEFRFVRGKSVSVFENAFKKIVGADHCIATSNGTSSLVIALKSLGITSGDEVITPAFSWISSAETITLCGACPVFADVDPKTYTLNPQSIERCITEKTKAVIAVHLYGQAAQISEIRKICKMHNLFLIEDCAQAQLTEVNGKAVGTFGDAGAFSFYPTKNLGAYGDAGCIITNNNILAEKIRRFGNHGALEKDDHTIEGMNSRMDTLQAAILNAKLPHLKKWNKLRRKNAMLYTELLSPVEQIVIPHEQHGTTHTFHLFVIRANDRDELKKYLGKKGIQTMIHYPQALTNTKAYSYLSLNRADFPVANTLQKEVLSLPIYPELTQDQIKFVCRIIKDFYRKVKSV